MIVAIFHRDVDLLRPGTCGGVSLGEAILLLSQDRSRENGTWVWNGAEVPMARPDHEEAA